MSQPTLTREGLAAALFSLVQALPGLQTSSRRLLHWSEVAPASQPAAFLAEGNQTPLQDASGLPSVWRYDYKIYLYAYNGDQTCSPSTLLNPIVDALEIALKPSISGPPGAARLDLRRHRDRRGRPRTPGHRHHPHRN